VTIPFSSLVSEKGKAAFLDRINHPLPFTPGDINKTRREIDEQFHKPLLEALHRLFPVNVTPEVIGGVQTDVVTPKAGISAKNQSRILINLHGGGFSVGARTGGQVESIPITGLGKLKVITVDYREGPENKFPAASEDVATVYQELLKKYKAKDIGIYGCSAGGILAAESLAWFQTHHLPTPGAVGIFGAGATPQSAGDSYYIGTLLAGSRLQPIEPEGQDPADYFYHTDIKDPLISPLYTRAVLAGFPPTLIITSTRDMEFSSAVYTHTQLIMAGADADLHVWEGMRHCFFFWPDPPESQEAWRVIINFFDRHLGRG
jgi:epsilon-lactone hydrolase